MPASSRLTDIWVGICCCHSSPTCIPMSGPIITSSGNHISLGLGQARLTDMTQGYCGHTGTIVSAAPTCVTNSLGKARIGSAVTGCNIGTVVTGNAKHEVGNGLCSGTGDPMVFSTVAKGTPVTYTEVDFGNQDDEPDTDDGYNVYPPIIGRAPSPSEIQKSTELDNSPTTTHATDSTAGLDTTTPVVSCLLAPEPTPDSFQLSPNFTLGDLSTDSLLSRTSVRAQVGLTYLEIVCNLQGWAENIGESLVAQYGNIQVVTSGFRAGNTTSQHNKGMAADLQYLNYNNQQVFEIAQFIKNNLNYDQLILEYGGNKPWIHVSFNRYGNRDSSASNKFGTRVAPGNYQWGDLLYMT